MTVKVSQVTRFAATYVNKDGMRTLMHAAQGRHLFDTLHEAQEWIDAVTQNNSQSTIEMVWGKNPQFAPRPCPCWPVSGDPQSVWFD